MIAPSSFRRIAASLGLLLLVGCQPSQPVDFKPLTFTRYQPIYLNVSSIEFVDEYKSPLKPPHVEHLLPYSPAAAMRIWARDRLRAIGSDKTLLIIIKDGSVTSTSLAKTEGLQGLFVISPDRRYDAKLNVELRIYGGQSAISEANVSVSAQRSVTVSEDASVSERDGVFRQMIAEMMTSVNAELEKNIFTYMANHINYSQNP